MRFENKVGIVTGSGGGIGQAYAEALAREGGILGGPDAGQVDGSFAVGHLSIIGRPAGGTA